MPLVAGEFAGISFLLNLLQSFAGGTVELEFEDVDMLLGLDDANSSQSEIFFSEQSKKFNTSVHNEESITESEEANINNDTIVEEIIKNNPSKGEDMIQLIESILSKSNSKKKK